MGDEIECRGSYSLGTACGRFRRCEQELLGLIDQLADPDPCHYDHHDLRQAHGLYDRPCPHGRAQQATQITRRREDRAKNGSL